MSALNVKVYCKNRLIDEVNYPDGFSNTFGLLQKLEKEGAVKDKEETVYYLYNLMFEIKSNSPEINVKDPKELSFEELINKAKKYPDSGAYKNIVLNKKWRKNNR